MARFTGTTFEAKAQEFARLYYRCVQLHCGKHVYPEAAHLIISDWVAACFTDEPILEFPSPLLSPILTMGSATLGSSESTQDSFQSFQSMPGAADLSSALLIASASSAARMDADADDFVGWGPSADEFFDTAS